MHVRGSETAAKVLAGILAACVAAWMAGCARETGSDGDGTHVVRVLTEEQFNAAIDAGGVVLVDFYADWCGPCRRLKPTIAGLAAGYEGRVTVLAVDVDRLRDLAGRHRVSSIPDVRVFAGGRQVAAMVGLQSKDRYVAVLDKALGRG